VSDERTLQSAAPTAEQSHGDLHVVPQSSEFGDCSACLLPVEAHFDRPHCSGNNIGCRGARTNAAHLSDRHVAKAFGLGLAQFYKRKARGDFRIFELEALPGDGVRRPGVRGAATRYSGIKLQRWIDGEPIEQSTPSTRRFFGSARGR